MITPNTLQKHHVITPNTLQKHHVITPNTLQKHHHDNSKYLSETPP